MTKLFSLGFVALVAVVGLDLANIIDVSSFYTQFALNLINKSF